MLFEHRLPEGEDLPDWYRPKLAALLGLVAEALGPLMQDQTFEARQATIVTMWAGLHGISTLAVFIALMAWGWLFGAVGMFLAVPLTTALIIALDASSHTRPLAILMGPAVSEEPADALSAKTEETSPR